MHTHVHVHMFMHMCMCMCMCMSCGRLLHAAYTALRTAPSLGREGASQGELTQINEANLMSPASVPTPWGAGRRHARPLCRSCLSLVQAAQGTAERRDFKIL